jgi:hypothetical protein
MPLVSVVVVAFNIPRALPRTLYSLSADCQLGIAGDAYEVIVVDNGSSPAVDRALLNGVRGNFRLVRIDGAPASPAYAVNRGIAEAQGEVIGVMIDGARLVTPGLIQFALAGARIHDRSVVASLGWYLGGDYQGAAIEAGYDEALEDALLASIGWPHDGYRLFEIGTMDESSTGGWFTPVAETNTLFLRREMWDALGGMDERFDMPGGGMVNLDTYARALEIEGARPVVLLGEASFHQVHGGVSTNARTRDQPDNWKRWDGQYRELRGKSFAMPVWREPPTLLGSLHPAARSRLVRAGLDLELRGARSRGESFDRDLWRCESTTVDGESPGPLVELAHAELRAGRPAAAAAVARIARRRHPRDRELQRILSLVAHASRDAQDAQSWAAQGDAHRLLGDGDEAHAAYAEALAHHPDCVRAHVGLSMLRMPAEHYLVWLQRLYALLAPETAIEIGVYQGSSLALFRPPTVVLAVDPKPLLAVPLRAETHIFAETSDEFFARRPVGTLCGGRPLSVGFIDGLHLFEQALRDFINIEAHSGPGTVILLHDTVPLDEPTQRRTAGTQFHTGDVWRTVLCLKKYRPDLDLFTIPAPPTGLTVVTGLDRSSQTLRRGYDAYVEEFLGVPYSAVQNDLYAHMNIVKADPAAIERRVDARQRRAGARAGISSGYPA